MSIVTPSSFIDAATICIMSQFRHPMKEKAVKIVGVPGWE
jgi:hypothetical protein